MSFIKKVLTLCIIISFVSGCTMNNEYHGYTFNDLENLETKIEKINGEKKSRIIEIFGSPTFEEKNDNGNLSFFYVENIFVKKPFVGAKNIENKILKITFGKDEKVIGSKFTTTKPGKVKFDNDKTTINAKNMTIFEQIKSNLTDVGK